MSTGNPGLSILPAGGATRVERPLFAHRPELEKALAELADSFDHLVLDLPAVLSTSEALALAEYAASLVLVVDGGWTIL